MGDVLVADWVDTTNTSLLVETTVGTPDSTPLFEMSLGAPCFELPPVVTLVVVDVEPAPAADAITVAAESLVEKAADILPHVGTTAAAIEPDDGIGRPLVFKLNSPVNPVPLPLIDAAVAGAIFESVDVTLEPLLWSFDELIETTGLPPLPSALVRFTDLSLDAEVELTGLSLATEVELPSRNPLVATAINTLSKDDVTVVTALAPPAVVVDDALPVAEVTSVAKVLAPPTEVTIDDLVSPTTVADDVRPTDDVVAAEVLVPPGTAPPDLTPAPPETDAARTRHGRRRPACHARRSHHLEQTAADWYCWAGLGRRGTRRWGRASAALMGRTFSRALPTPTGTMARRATPVPAVSSGTAAPVSAAALAPSTVSH